MMMANLNWNNNDPMENRIRQVMKDWESAPPSGWDTPPDALWHKIAPAPPAGAGLPHLWKWIGGGLVFSAALTAVVLTIVPAPSKQGTTPMPTVQDTVIGKPYEGVLREFPAQPEAIDPSPGIAQESKPAATTGIANSVERVAVSPLRLAAPAAAKRDGDNGLADDPAARKIDELLINESVVQATSEADAVLLPETNLTETTDMVASESEMAGLQMTETPAPFQEQSGEGALATRSFSPAPALEAASVSFLASGSLAESQLEWLRGHIRRAPGPGRFFAGVLMSPNHTFRRIQSSRPVNQLPAFLRDNEFASWTTEFGLRAGWKPGRRFALSTGLSLYNMGQQSLHRFRVPYDPVRERPLGNNNFAGTYSLAVPSAYGDADVEVSVQRPGSQAIAAGQVIVVEMRTDMQIQYVTLPLHAYYFVHSGRWSAGVKGGVALNFMREQRFTATARIFQRGLLSRTVAVQHTPERTNRMIPDYQVGGALWYRPHPGWMLSFEPSFRQSLRPVVEREAYSVSQYAWGLQVGVQKIF